MGGGPHEWTLVPQLPTAARALVRFPLCFRQPGPSLMEDWGPLGLFPERQLLPLGRGERDGLSLGLGCLEDLVTWGPPALAQKWPPQLPAWRASCPFAFKQLCLGGT